MSNRFENFLRCYALPLGLVLLALLVQLIFRDVPLFSLLNIKNILLQTASIALTALGLSFIMMGGEGDMSFAGMFSLLTVVFATVANMTNSFLLALASVVFIALFVNLVISLLVTKLHLSSFITSIAVMFMAIGIEKVFHQQTTLIQNEGILSFSTVELGIPLVVWLMVFIYIIAYVLVYKTRYGFDLRIVGENKNAAIEAGIDVNWMKISSYLVAGLLIGLASAIESTRVGAIYQQGQFYMLPIFAAVYLGSSMFVPGRVNVVGTLFGAIFMGVVQKFLNMINVESFIVSIVQGVILIISVGIVAFKNREKITQVKL